MNSYYYKYCQSSSYNLPNNWVLAPDNSDSRYVIYLKTWSTYAVVVASGVGYYSDSSYYGSIYRTYMLQSYYSYYSGYSYACSPCNCQILIMYVPTSTIRSPTYSPVYYTGDDSSSSSSSSSALLWLYALLLVPFFCSFCCAIYHRSRLGARTTQIQRIQVQPSIERGVTTNTEGYYAHPSDGDNNDNVVQAEPIMIYGNNSSQQEPQQQYPYSLQPQPPQQDNQPQVYGYGQQPPQSNGNVYPEAQPYNPYDVSQVRRYSSLSLVYSWLV